MSVRLKYTGKGEYIMMIPNRDLTDYDIETILARTGETEEVLISHLIKHNLYVRSDEFPCMEPGCGRIFKSWQALNKHELKHIEELTEAIAEISEEDSDNG